ncbi:MAG: Oxidoreductase family, NAD-binding Rossmann fold [Lentisphaerae bacterium ADurb.Bin242]|nr:MAG: Oxidoreductase family, NAD-binding Rossmann fold [Lentisphaerae bacterium ADurb.Bin242]
MKLVRNENDIRLGIIGMTEGNGHPYSWSAIFNKFNRQAMTEECPFPAIPAYLNKEDYDSIGIPGAKVTHVFCDKRSDAKHVAKLSLVEHVVGSPEEMLGSVDAVIIATDIGSEHVRRAEPFLEAGVPLFIDKPLCDNAADLEFFRKAVAADTSLLSSSPMRYCKEFQPYHNGKTREFGDLRLLSFAIPKKWETYGIHALEAVYPIAGPGFESIVNTGSEKRNIVHLKHKKGFDVVIANIDDAAYSPTLTILGTKGSTHVVSGDSYGSFRNQMVAFVQYLRTGERPYPFAETEELMHLVIGSIESRKNGGKEVKI